VHLPDGPAFLSFATDITARKAAEELIRETGRQYRDIFTEAPEGIFRVTKEGRLLAVNPAGARMLGYDSAEDCLAGGTDLARSLWMRPEDRSAYTSLLEKNGEIQGFQCAFKRKDGLPIWVSITARRVADKQGNALYYQGFLENQSEKKQLEHDLKDRIREIELRSEMNNALLHATTEEGLLKEYCRIVVEVGGYRMAWVGFADTGPGKRVIPVAHFGHEDGYLAIANITWDESEHGRGPTGRAIRSGQMDVVERYAGDPRTTPWCAEATKRGYHSAIAIPFRHSDNGMACLTVYGASDNVWSESELKLMHQIAAALGFGITTLRTAIAKHRYQRDLAASLEQTIEVISQAVDQRDPYTAGHQKRVADLCSRIGEKMGLDPDRIQGLRLAATIHDLGKIGIPSEILSKPGKLTPIQYELIKEHAQVGCEVVRNVRFPWPIGEIILQHHERLDGSGYPRGLRGDAILLEARILAVADVTEAMGSHRPYRAARGIEVALEEILSERGTLYDPAVVDACVALVREDGYSFPA
jgi:PAS domain S-box-containing protein